MRAYPLTALSTLLIVVLLFWVAFNVGRARVVHGIKAPAMTGHPAFECAVRVQMNTMEMLMAFLPCLWIFAIFVSDRWAAIVGVVWVIGRVWYAIGYQREPEQRHSGFGLSFLAFMVALLGGAYGVIRVLVLLAGAS